MTYHQYAHLRSGLVLGIRSPVTCYLLPAAGQRVASEKRQLPLLAASERWLKSLVSANEARFYQGTKIIAQISIEALELQREGTLRPWSAGMLRRQK